MDQFRARFIDGLELLYKHSEDVLRSTTEIGNIFKKLSVTEDEYGKSLQKLARAVKERSSKAAGNESLTVREGLETLQGGLEALGNKHVAAGSAAAEVAGGLANFVKERDTQRKRMTSDGQRASSELVAAVAALKKARADYESKCRAGELAAAAYQRAKADGSTKPKEVVKAHQKMVKAQETAAMADREYRRTLKVANERQSRFYETVQPALLDEFGRFEHERLSFVRASIDRLGALANELPSAHEAFAHCVDEAHGRIDVEGDLQAFIEANATDAAAPTPIEYAAFEPELSGAAMTAGGAPQSGAAAGTVRLSPVAVAAVAAGAGGGGGAEGALSPRQAEEARAALSSNDRERLLASITEIKDAIQAETNQKKGLEKLVKFYANDPSAQEKARGELDDQVRKLAAMKEQLQALETRLAELPSDGTDDDEAAALGDNRKADDDDEVDAEVVCVARAQYAYEATNDSELSFKAGDLLEVTEQDDSGWWFARLGPRSGFVPRNYVKSIDS